MSATDVYSFEVNDIEHRTVSLEKYRGKVLLIVNVASRCGFTPQYSGLQRLYEKFRGQGLEILGFPCNQFGAQEPGAEEEIHAWCELNFGVTFPLFEKIDVNGEGAHPLFEYLKGGAPGLLGTEAVKWNFTKFLVGTDGRVAERFAPSSAPEALEQQIVQHLQLKPG